MNAIQPTTSSPPPPPGSGNDSNGNGNGNGNGESIAAAGPSQGFASALAVESPRPVKKPTAARAEHASGGGPLPATGIALPAPGTALPAAGTALPLTGFGLPQPDVAKTPAAPLAAAPGGAVAASTAMPTAADGKPPAPAGASPLDAPSAPASDPPSPQPSQPPGTSETSGNDAATATALAVVSPRDPGTVAGTVLQATRPGGAIGAVSRAAGTHASTDKPGSATGAAATRADPGARPAASSTAADASGADQTAAADIPAGALADIGVAAQNPAAVADSLATPATGIPGGAATTASPLSAQGADAADAAVAASTAASATAAAAASTARVITQLAMVTAADKATREDVRPAATTAASAAGAADAAQLMAGGMATSGPDATTPAPSFAVRENVDSSEFGQGVAAQVGTMVASDINNAKLTVNPPSLGPIEVRIAVQGTHAQVWMVSHSAVTRDALQAGTPKLREMLGGQGFGQVSVDISQRSFQDRTPAAPRYEWAASADRDDYGAAAVSSPAGRSSSGTLDAYA